MIRHDAAHVLAEAVQELYPGTQVTIGPTIENGFYYDFARNEPFTPEDFPAIEAKMREIVAAQRARSRARCGTATRRSPSSSDKRREVQGASSSRTCQRARRSRSIAQGDWIDLCRGPHMRSHRRCRHGVQADEGGRRLLARRPPQRHARAASTAPPGATRRNSTPTCTCWRRPSGATTAASARNMDLFHMQEEAGRQRLLAPEGLDALPHASRTTCAAGSTPPATRR